MKSLAKTGFSQIETGKTTMIFDALTPKGRPDFAGTDNRTDVIRKAG